MPGVAFSLRQGDLFSISKEERDALLDSILTGAGYPFVLLDGVVVHSWDLSAEAIAQALRGGAVTG